MNFDPTAMFTDLSILPFTLLIILLLIGAVIVGLILAKVNIKIWRWIHK